MKIGVLGDVHGNWPALQSVLKELDEANVDKIYCTGDLVGLLGWNDKVVTAARDFDLVVLGNHDARFHPDYDYSPAEKYKSPEQVEIMTAESYMVRAQLSEENMGWLNSLPEEVYDSETDVYITHNDPNKGGVGMKDGELGVKPRHVTKVNTDNVDGYWVLLGHSHEVINQNLDKFDGKTGHIINPGSVGFPISGPATYAIIDTNTMESTIHTAQYDASRVEDKLEETGAQSLTDN